MNALEKAEVLKDRTKQFAISDRYRNSILFLWREKGTSSATSYFDPALR